MSQPLIGPNSLIAVSGRRWSLSLEAAVRNGQRLEHYRRLLDRPDRQWMLVGVISDQATGPGELAMVDATLTAQVGEDSGPACYRLDGTGWQREAGPVRPLRLAAPLVQFSGSTQPQAVATCIAAGRAQALVEEAGSVFSYQLRRDGRWQRSACLRLNDPVFSDAANSSVKLAQVSGELDATTTGRGERRPSLSRSRSTAGIRGTDLGVRFEHQGRSFLFCGDTHWSRPWLALRDSIAEVFDEEPLPRVVFHGSPLRLVGAGTTMGEYDVPLDAFSLDGQLYAFFSSNHFRNAVTMGRSVLARCEDPGLAVDSQRRHRPIRFRALATLSEWSFINVSAQLRPSAEVPGCGTDGEVLLLWGTGAYRASQVRLASLDGAALRRLAELPGRVSTAELGLRYWDGTGWSEQESEAVPLFGPGAFGELSVRWVPAANRYALLTATGPQDPAGNAITLRWADDPWGPWTSRLRLLDWVAEGMSPDPFTRFIKAGADDPVGESIFAAQANGNGAAYAPYLFDSRRDGADLVLRYTLSTWNPYQVVLLEHRLVPGEF